MSRKAFTLIELLVVISIISLLSSVVLASLNTSRDKARIAAGKRFAATVDNVAGDQAVGWWDFDGCGTVSASDKSGANNTATFQNGALTSTNSPYSGCSLSLDGINDYASASDAAFPSGNSPRSISAWFNLSSMPATNACKIIAAYGTAATNNGYGVAACNIGGTLGIRQYGWSNDMDTPVGFTTGIWYHVATTFDGTTAATYFNGALLGTANKSTWNTVLSSVRIGANINVGATDVLGGYIDNVRFYAKTLTASEVGKLYASGESRYGGITRR